MGHYKIGHYLNMLSKGAFVTGIAYIPGDREDLSNSAGCFAQEFANNTDYFESGIGLKSATDSNKIYDTRIGQMTVSEFETMFNKYYDNLDKNVASKKAAYEAALKQAQEFNDSSMSSELKAIYDAYMVALNNLKNEE